jgi:hypothetical protein
MRAVLTSPEHLIFIYLNALTIPHQQYTLQTFQLCNSLQTFVKESEQRE